jgi:hypothetical protein
MAEKPTEKAVIEATGRQYGVVAEVVTSVVSGASGGVAGALVQQGVLKISKGKQEQPKE